MSSALALLLLALTACSSTGEAGGGEVCSACVAGGETSDFGSGESLPSPCEVSEARLPIDEAAARQLGFGPTLDRLTRSFTAELSWTAADPSEGPPARGYAPSTEVEISTSVASIVHRVPALAGCADSLALVLDVSLRTTDGALAIAGQLRANQQGDEQYIATGNQSLAAASGSLRVSPPDWPGPAHGSLAMLLNFAAEEARGALHVGLWSGGSSAYPQDRNFDPLTGKFPPDPCSYRARPLRPDEPSDLLSNRSVLQLRDDLIASNQLDQPGAGSWRDAIPTLVTTELGLPSSICENPASVSYEMPLRITTADGRADIDGIARAAAVDADGVPSMAWVELSSHGKCPLAADFAEDSGISGVDLSGLSGACWSANLTLVRINGTTGPTGIVTVEGFTEDGLTAGSVDTLSWR